MKKWQIPLIGKACFLPERLEEWQQVEVNVLWNGKNYPTPAKLHQREDGEWILNFSIGNKFEQPLFTEPK